MLKIFFATFFIAELIIAFFAIAKIRNFNKRVNTLNALVTSNKVKVRDGLKDFKWLLADYVNDFRKLRAFVKLKKEEYLFRVLKTSLIYSCILLLRGKYKRGVLVYQVLSEIYEGFSEVEF